MYYLSKVPQSKQDRHKCWYLVKDYFFKHKFLVILITDCFLKQTFTQCIGTVFAEAQWSGGVFLLPLY